MVEKKHPVGKDTKKLSRFSENVHGAFRHKEERKITDTHKPPPRPPVKKGK